MSPYSLSIREGRICVTPLNSKQLLIFNSEQKLKKRIPLPGRMEPRHAAETDHKTVIVCHWGRRNNTNMFQIGEFDSTGNQVKVFSGPDDLNDFPHMNLDVDGRVLVVDSWNCRVILLNKDLQLERTLVEHLQLERTLVEHLDNNPYRLCYVERTGRLYVGESGESVKVYDISYPPSTENHVQK